MNRQPVSRRRFLQASMRAGAAAGVAPLFVPASALGYGRPAPSDRIHVGFIGVGWKGLEGCWGSLVQGFTANPLCRSLAVCDINSQKCQKAKQTIDEPYGNTDCRVYRDFRELLACDDIDSAVHLHQDLGPGLLEQVMSPSLWVCENQKRERTRRCTGAGEPDFIRW